jgi:HEPN domain-containing protein
MMLSKSDHINYWSSTAEENWNRVDWLLEKKDYVFALFCLHLSLEKLAKAIWVKENQANFPPRIHELKYILTDTSLLLYQEQAKFVDDLQKYQIEVRYPDYKQYIKKYTYKPYVEDMISKAKTLRKCLLDKIL